MSATLVHQNLSTISTRFDGSSRSREAFDRLRREAAHLGPGLSGVRRDGSEAERRALACRFDDVGEPVPRYLLARHEWTDRRARLIWAPCELGPGLTLNSAHLARLVREFDAPQPMLLTPNGELEPPEDDAHLGLGYITALELEQEQGHDALLATVTLSAQADLRFRSCGQATLSIELAPDLSRLVLVRFLSTFSEDARLPPPASTNRTPGEPERGPTFTTSLGVAVPMPWPGGDRASPPESPYTGSPYTGAEAREFERLLTCRTVRPDQLRAARRLMAAGAQLEIEANEIRRLLTDLLRPAPEHLDAASTHRR